MLNSSQYLSEIAPESNDWWEILILYLGGGGGGGGFPVHVMYTIVLLLSTSAISMSYLLCRMQERSSSMICRTA